MIYIVLQIDCYDTLAYIPIKTFWSASRALKWIEEKLKNSGLERTFESWDGHTYYTFKIMEMEVDD